MNCVICKSGKTEPGEVTVTLPQRASTIILKQVPADVCDNCGEYYHSDVIAEKVLARAQTAVENGAEVEILRFAT